MDKNCSSLNACAFGASLGTVWGISVLILGLVAMFTGYGSEFVTSLSTVYLGYAATWLGSLIGFVWGLIDGFVGGFLIAWFYNCFNKCMCCKKS